MNAIGPTGALVGRVLNPEADARYLAGRELVRQIAPLLRVGEEQAFGVLTSLPENMLCLLESPEGWTTLVACIAAQCGLTGCAYQPTHH